MNYYENVFSEIGSWIQNWILDTYLLDALML